MTPFLSTHTLVLTPLSPIHIGCGEDFEPTHYVIEDGLLYGFDPSRAALSEVQRSKLGEAARRGSLDAIQRFFREHAAAFKPHTHVVMPVAKGVAQLYDKRVGRAANIEADGNKVFNQLAIERHVHTGPQQWPFIPGSSFKGALRTAWLDDLNAGRKPLYEDNVQKGTAQMEKRLLWGPGQERQLGDFQTSPLRLLKVADLMPTAEPEREVLFAVNRKKRQIIGRDGQIVQAQGPSARKDCIRHGQYRLFRAEVTLPALLAHAGAKNPKGQPIAPPRNQLNAAGAVDLARLARQSNAYHQQRLRRELAVLDGRGLVNPDWKRGIEALLAPGSELDKKLSAGQAFLIRLGRYGGAESKTLTGVASIKIMGAKGEKPTFEPTTKTVWLAAQFETEQKHLIPFGWAVVEIDPRGECAALQKWCHAQAQGRPRMADVRAQLQAQKQAAEQQKAQLAAQAAERAAQAEAERAAAQARAAALAAMSAQAQQIEQLRQKCQDWLDKLPPKGNYKKIEPNPAKAGLYKEALDLVHTALQSPDWSAADKAALADMLETWLPQIVAPWEPKEQRKKLSLAKLRGHS